MSNSIFRMAVATLAIITATSIVHAIPPDEPPDIEVYIAGSPDQDASLDNLMRLTSGVPGTPNICQRDTLDIYHGTIAGTPKRVYYCLTSEHIDGVPAGLRLAVHKSSGGSGEGVEPVAKAKHLAFIDLGELPENRACSKATQILHAGNLAAYSIRRDCGGKGKLAAPSLGVADIEPSLLGENTTGLSFRSKSQVVWGLPVSKNFRNALQAIQGLVPADVAHDAAVRETEDMMPSLTSYQVASIFAGTIDSWSQLYDQNGNPSYLSNDLPVHPPTLRDLSGTRPGAYQPNAEGGQKVYVCRRTSRSGAQAAYETRYLKRRCMADAPLFVAADDGSDHREGGDPESLVRRPDPTGRVFAGKDTVAVRACLDAHDEHNRWAIGMFSTAVRGNNLSDEFRHIKVDGYAPTLINAHRGLWRHVSEPTLQWRTADVWRQQVDHAGRTLQFLTRNIGKPRVLRALNLSARHPWGHGGYLAMPDGDAGTESLPVTTETLRDFPVAGVSQSNVATRDCHMPLIRGSSSAAH